MLISELAGRKYHSRITVPATSPINICHADVPEASVAMLPAFVLFFREGLEASLIVTILLASLRQLDQMRHARAVWAGVWLSALGAALAILAAVGLCVLIYRMGYRLDYRLFFRVMGILLLVFAAGLLGDAIQNMQQLGWLHVGTSALWNTSRMLPEDSLLGDLLPSFFRCPQAPPLFPLLLLPPFLPPTRAPPCPRRPNP